MAMASAKAHTLRPIFVTEGGAELPVTSIAIALAVLLSGPGKYSLDRVLGVRLPAWLAPLGLMAIALTVVYASGQEEPQPEEEEARERLAGEEGA
jgi:putative oxidoreductase